jgi:hypothetical protein
MFSVRWDLNLNSYIRFRRNSAFKVFKLTWILHAVTAVL